MKATVRQFICRRQAVVTRRFGRKTGGAEATSHGHQRLSKYRRGQIVCTDHPLRDQRYKVPARRCRDVSATFFDLGLVTTWYYVEETDADEGRWTQHACNLTSPPSRRRLLTTNSSRSTPNRSYHYVVRYPLRPVPHDASFGFLVLVAADTLRPRRRLGEISHVIRY